MNESADPVALSCSAAGTSPSRPRGAVTAAGLAMLIGEMALGRQDALAQLFDETSPLLNGLLLRMLERPEDAEEALTDVYMKAWKNASSYSAERGSVQSWLVIMARSIAIDRIRQKRARPKTSCVEFGDGFASQASSPEEQTETALQCSQVRRVLQELPSEQREALVMAFFGGLSHSELALRLDQPLGTVKSRIRAALMRLRSLLEEEAGA